MQKLFWVIYKITNCLKIAFDSGLVLDPTSEELLKARGEANQFLKKQTRFEHMDDNFRNHTVDDLCANVRMVLYVTKKVGLSISKA